MYYLFAVENSTMPTHPQFTAVFPLQTLAATFSHNSTGLVEIPQNSPKGVIAPLALSYTNSSFVSSRFRPAVSGRNSNVHKRPKNVKTEKNQKVPFG